MQALEQLVDFLEDINRSYAINSQTVVLEPTDESAYPIEFTERKYGWIQAKLMLAVTGVKEEVSNFPDFCKAVEEVFGRRVTITRVGHKFDIIGTLRPEADHIKTEFDDFVSACNLLVPAIVMVVEATRWNEKWIPLIADTEVVGEA